MGIIEGISAALQALPQLLKLINWFITTMKKTPAEKRRESLIDFDKAMDKANKNDLGDLSKWFGKRL